MPALAEDINNSKIEQEYELDSYRYVNLAVFSAALAVNSMSWSSILPMSGALYYGYDVGQEEIAVVSMIFMGVYVLATIPALIVLDRWGCHNGVLNFK